MGRKHATLRIYKEDHARLVKRREVLQSHVHDISGKRVKIPLTKVFNKIVTKQAFFTNQELKDLSRRRRRR